MSIATEIEQFIVSEIAQGRGIDSLGIVELISFLERSYSIKVADEDLDPENFRSVDTIVAFVARKGG